MSDPAKQTTSPPSLHAKLAEVAATVGHIPKRGRNEFHKYDYAMEADIVDAVRGELASRRVALLPSIHEVRRDGTMTTVVMSYTFVDGETGEQHSCPWAGTGDDKGDKGLYKAITGATKYFLLKTFLMPTGDDPESDEATDKRAYGATRRAPERPALELPERASRGFNGPDAPPPSEAEVAAEADKHDHWVKTMTDPPAPIRPDLGAQATERKRAFAVMARYGISNAVEHRGERLAIYGKALQMGRLPTETEAKQFTAVGWRAIADYIERVNTPPDDLDVRA